MADQNHSSRDLVSLTILALLAEQPRHPYEMQRLIRERHKDFARVNPRGLYHAVDRLVKAGLIEPVETSREGKRPERTIYRLTAEGREDFNAWLGELLSTPLPEYPVFTAAVSFLAHLPIADVAKALETRAILLEGEIAGLDAYTRGLGTQLHRLVLLELEYTRALRQAELEWVRALSEDIRTGKLTWDPDLLHGHSEGQA